MKEKDDHYFHGIHAGSYISCGLYILQKMKRAEKAEQKKKAKAKGDREITIWCWDTSDNGKKMNAGFTEATGIKVNMVAVESKDMTQKLQTTLASGGEMPDVAWLEATYRGKLLSLDIWENITKDPYNFDTSQVLDYLIPLETSESGQYVGPEYPSVVGMAYKRELAKEYLGTDDPQELEAMLSEAGIPLLKKEKK